MQLISNKILLYSYKITVILLGTPVLTLTGTADSKTQNVIISELAMKIPVKLFISPNRENLRISVVKCSKDKLLCHLLWLVKLMEPKGLDTPKTIIFCNGTLNDMATIFNFLLLKLKDKAYVPAFTRNADNCIIGMYHSLTLEKYKDRVVKSFKENGKKTSRYCKYCTVNGN